MGNLRPRLRLWPGRSFCGLNTRWLIVAILVVAVRDSKDLYWTALHFSIADWETFDVGVRPESAISG